MDGNPHYCSYNKSYNFDIPEILNPLEYIDFLDNNEWDDWSNDNDDDEWDNWNRDHEQWENRSMDQL